MPFVRRDHWDGLLTKRARCRDVAILVNLVKSRDDRNALPFFAELLYFDDGDVPPLVESEAVYETAQYDYNNIVNPSSTHKACFDSSSSLPSSKSDFETTEFTTPDYQAIDSNDANYKETANPGADEYLYHKFLLLSSIDSSDVRRFRIRVVICG